MSWANFENTQPELARYGVERFQKFGVAYLATVRKDGAPRVHPVTPIVGRGRLFLFMEPTSPKGHDLRRDGRYALHCSVSDSSGNSGEFYISGHAKLVDDAATRALAIDMAPYIPANRYVLFELEVESASSTKYIDGLPERTTWQAESK